ncbi:MAG: Zn-ribbon domain-containing OB-fold protein [Acidobacteriia bacterium]|nr:Zn-ribbon domain-containing OB-fold protein [Terriglobia bacterium]
MPNPARYWREIPQRYRLEAGKCTSCGEVFFPPRLICTKCRCRRFETVKLHDEGHLVTYTVIRVGPSQFADQTPYAVGIVELDGGVRITIQIVDCEFDKLVMGQRMRIEFRRLQKQGDAGILCYGYKCVPA